MWKKTTSKDLRVWQDVGSLNVLEKSVKTPCSHRQFIKVKWSWIIDLNSLHVNYVFQNGNLHFFCGNRISQVGPMAVFAELISTAMLSLIFVAITLMFVMTGSALFYRSAMGGQKAGTRKMLPKWWSRKSLDGRHPVPSCLWWKTVGSLS